MLFAMVHYRLGILQGDDIGLEGVPVAVRLIQAAGRSCCGQTDPLGRRVQRPNGPGHQLTKSSERLKGP